MSEAAASLGTPNLTETHAPPVLTLVEDIPDIVLSRVDFALARGPFVGRLLAQERLLDYAEDKVPYDVYETILDARDESQGQLDEFDLTYVEADEDDVENEAITETPESLEAAQDEQTDVTEEVPTEEDVHDEQPESALDELEPTDDELDEASEAEDEPEEETEPEDDNVVEDIESEPAAEDPEPEEPTAEDLAEEPEPEDLFADEEEREGDDEEGFGDKPVALRSTLKRGFTHIHDRPAKPVVWPPQRQERNPETKPPQEYSPVTGLPVLSAEQLQTVTISARKDLPVSYTGQRRKVVFLGAPSHRDVLEEEEPAGWQSKALCAQTDPEAFFPEKGGSTREAKKICLGCEVRGECLEDALLRGDRFGIAGGLSERERRVLEHKGRTAVNAAILNTPVGELA